MLLSCSPNLLLGYRRECVSLLLQHGANVTNTAEQSSPLCAALAEYVLEGMHTIVQWRLTSYSDT